MSDSEDDVPPPPPEDDSEEEPPPPPEDGDDDEDDPEFDKMYAEQFQQLERLRVQQAEQEKQLQQLQAQQKEQSARHEQLTKEQQAELDRLKKETEIQGPAQPEVVSHETSASAPMEQDLIEKLRASFDKMRDSVARLNQAFSKFDYSLGMSVHDDDVINELMRQFLVLHPKLIGLIMSGAITDSALLTEANQLNDAMHAVVSTYKKLERDSASGAVVKPVNQAPIRDRGLVNATASPAPVQAAASPVTVAQPAKAQPAPVAVSAASTPQTPASPASSATGATPAPVVSVPASPMPGGRHLTIIMEKVRLFGSSEFVNPTVTVLVVGKTGRQLESPRDFSAAKRTATTSPHIMPFGFTITLQHSLQDFHPDCSVIFELKHFKSKKNKVSTKCWGYFFIDESRDGFFEIPLYQKPTDLKRRNLKLLPVEHGVHPHIALQLVVR